LLGKPKKVDAGQIYRNEHSEEKGNELNIATWNVLSLNRAGSFRGLKEELKKIQYWDSCSTRD
jgi:hypothetical protein